jgi:hypothetical protein
MSWQEIGRSVHQYKTGVSSGKKYRAPKVRGWYSEDIFDQLELRNLFGIIARKVWEEGLVDEVQDGEDEQFPYNGWHISGIELTSNAYPVSRFHPRRGLLLDQGRAVLGLNMRYSSVMDPPAGFDISLRYSGNTDRRFIDHSKEDYATAFTPRKRYLGIDKPIYYRKFDTDSHPELKTYFALGKVTTPEVQAAIYDLIEQQRKDDCLPAQLRQKGLAIMNELGVQLPYRQPLPRSAPRYLGRWARVN